MKDFTKLEKLTDRLFDTRDTMALLQSSGAKFGSWGVEHANNIKDRGLLLKVNGHHHTGIVFIVLDWSDTYTVYYLDYDYNEVKPKATDIYFDMLVDEIDRTIERIPEYKS